MLWSMNCATLDKNSAAASRATTGYRPSATNEPTGFDRLQENGRRIASGSDSGSTKKPYSPFANVTAEAK